MNGDCDETTDRIRLRWLTGIMAALAVPFGLIWFPGCRQYPPVTSPESLSLMKLLYAACNTKDPVRLAKVEQGVAKLAAEKKMEPAEQRGFESIIALAKAGQWTQAEDAAYKFAQDQVGVGHPNSSRPHRHPHKH